MIGVIFIVSIVGAVSMALIDNRRHYGRWLPKRVPPEPGAKGRPAPK